MHKMNKKVNLCKMKKRATQKCARWVDVEQKMKLWWVQFKTVQDENLSKVVGQTFNCFTPLESFFSNIPSNKKMGWKNHRFGEYMNFMVNRNVWDKPWMSKLPRFPVFGNSHILENDNFVVRKNRRRNPGKNLFWPFSGSRT